MLGPQTLVYHVTQSCPPPMETIICSTSEVTKSFLIRTFHLLSQKPYEIGIVGIPTLQTRKLMSREAIILLSRELVSSRQHVLVHSPSSRCVLADKV